MIVPHQKSLALFDSKAVHRLVRKKWIRAEIGHLRSLSSGASQTRLFLETLSSQLQLHDDQQRLRELGLVDVL